MRSIFKLSVFSVSALVAPTVAHANVGIPVVSFGLPLMALNLIFIVLIETLITRRLRSGLDFVAVLREIFVANGITTIIGYPVVAVIEAATAIFGINLGWLLPFEDLGKMGFYVSTAMLLTLIPSYFLSVWIEARWLKRLEIPRKVVWISNAVSYAFLTLQVYLLPSNFLLGLGHYTYETSYAVVMRLIGLFIGNE